MKKVTINLNEIDESEKNNILGLIDDLWDAMLDHAEETGEIEKIGDNLDDPDIVEATFDDTGFMTSLELRKNA
jgi:hypothetical protein